MKQIQLSVALAGLLALALAISGCQSTQGASGARGSSGAAGATGSDINRDYSLPTEKPAGTGDRSGRSGTSGTSGTSGIRSETGGGADPTIQDGAGASGSSGASGAAGTGTATGTDSASMHDDRANTASLANVIPNSTVLAIEAIPQSSGISEGETSLGASGAAGVTSSAEAGQPWRVTVRMDDGSTQVITHSSTPDFRSGDRINVTSGAIQR